MWHSFDIQEVLKKLNSDSEKGLSEKEVFQRQEKFGRNLLPEEKPLSKLRIFLEQLKSPLIYILIIAGIVTLFLGEYTDSIVIFGAVLLNTIVGFFQENKASQALRELKKVLKIKTVVFREEKEKEIFQEELVPGDIFILKAGDKVPADGKIIESYNLKINEAPLTGEWLAATKNIDILPENTPMADRDNMVYMGTTVEDGVGRTVVTEIGAKTEIGKVATLIKETKEEKTPYQKKLARFSKVVGFVITIICLIIFIEGLLTGGEFIEMFTVAIAIAVSAIPEGLPVAMTVILALAMQKILKRKGLVRRLASAETLGSTSIICTDKTLTLTEGKMKVFKIVTSDMTEKSQKLAIIIATLCNEAFIENPEEPFEEPFEKWRIKGRPTDRALLLASLEMGISKPELEKKMPIMSQLPFNPINKYIATFHQLDKNHQILYLCGAPEKLLNLSSKLEINGEQKQLNEKKLKELKEELNELTSKGLRVVAVGYKKITNSKSQNYNLEELCTDLTFVGFITLKDPLRKETKEAIRICKEAGMKPIIVTGDHKLTAKAVAEELGFKVKEGNIIEGRDLDKMSDEEFSKKIKNIQVFARVEPAHKMRIIQTWQERGEVVAMTGDGINDAPALKKADIGVALGSGTEVAKEVSDLVLLNDNFSIIVAAIEEGRAIIDNIRKVITYLLSDSFTEVILIGGSMTICWLTKQAWILPISAVQILWVNLIADGLPSIALAFEPKEKDLMKQKPQPRSAPLLTREMKVIIFVIGLVTDLILLGIFFWLLNNNYEVSHIRTIIFTALGIDSLFYVFSCKSLRKNIWHINFFSNKLLVLACLVGIIVLFMATYLPVFQNLLKTVPLGPFDWLILIGLGVIEIILIEIAKHYFIVRKQTQI